jgi:hypothetical protein
VGIPDWAIGVGFIMLALFGGIGLMGRLAPGALQSSRRRPGRHRWIPEEALPAPGEAGTLQAKLGEIDDLQRRLAEVEERLDFAERLLAKQRDADRLPMGGEQR